MNILKYKCREKCIIKSNIYSDSVEFINQLVAIAKKDYPDLADSEISVKVYNDNGWGKQTGIEFERHQAHPDYMEMPKLPFTYN